MKEIFKIIEEFPEYEISNLGNVISNTKQKKGNIIKQRLTKHGYYKFDIHRIGQYTHRFVALTFINNPENKPCVNHINGIKTDNRVENLEWVTHSENSQHAWDTNLISRVKSNIGEKNGSNKLTEENVIKIKSLLKTTNMFYREIAEMFNVNITTIASIKHRKTWKYLKEE